MPIYTLEGPDGKKYRIEGPEGATAEQLASVIQGNGRQARAAAQLEADRKTFDPTVGMSGTDRFLAGVGKAMTDVGRGVGQMVGLVDRKDIAESRTRDAALMNTGAGITGNVVGNIAALAPTMFIPGANTIAGSAAIGAASGLVQPSESTGETLRNIAIGGTLAPAAIVAGRVVQAAGSGLGAIRDTFTDAGQQRIARDLLRASATNPDQAIQSLRTAKPLVPGSSPTVAQVARDPGLAQLERSMLNNPEMAAPIQQRLTEQQAARLQAIRNVAGTDEYFNAIKDGRAIFAREDYAKALQQGIDPQAAEALAPQLQSLMSRPSIKEAQGVARRLAAESDVALDDFGSLQGLDWLKKALDNQISKASAPGSSIGKQELRALTQTKDDLMNVLDELAPGYRAANDNYAAMSRQVNSMEVGRDLLSKVEQPFTQPGMPAKEMSNAYRRALGNATESVKRQTGMDVPLERVMNTADIQALENVAFDMARKQFAQEAGKATGSNTAQNLISQNMLRRFLGPTGLPEGMADNTILNTLLRPAEFAGRLAAPRIQNHLAELMLDPERAAAALQAARAFNAPAPSGNMLLRLSTQPALLTSGFAANRPQQ